MDTEPIKCPECGGTGRNPHTVDGECNCCLGCGETTDHYIRQYNQHVRDLAAHRDRQRRRRFER